MIETVYDSRHLTRDVVGDNRISSSLPRLSPNGRGVRLVLPKFKAIAIDCRRCAAMGADDLEHSPAPLVDDANNSELLLT